MACRWAWAGKQVARHGHDHGHNAGGSAQSTHRSHCADGCDRLVVLFKDGIAGQEGCGSQPRTASGETLDE